MLLGASLGLVGYPVARSRPENAVGWPLLAGDPAYGVSAAGWLGNASIAARLSLARSTVGNHVTSIFAKIQVTDRSAAIVKAREGGLAGR